MKTTNINQGKKFQSDNQLDCHLCDCRQAVRKLHLWFLWWFDGLFAAVLEWNWSSISKSQKFVKTYQKFWQNFQHNFPNVKVKCWISWWADLQFFIWTADIRGFHDYYTSDLKSHNSWLYFWQSQSPLTTVTVNLQSLVVWEAFCVRDASSHDAKCFILKSLSRFQWRLSWWSQSLNIAWKCEDKRVSWRWLLIMWLAVLGWWWDPLVWNVTSDTGVGRGRGESPSHQADRVTCPPKPISPSSQHLTIPAHRIIHSHVISSQTQ